MQSRIDLSFVCLVVLVVNSLHGASVGSVSFSTINKITDSA